MQYIYAITFGCTKMNIKCLSMFSLFFCKNSRAQYPTVRILQFTYNFHNCMHHDLGKNLNTISKLKDLLNSILTKILMWIKNCIEEMFLPPGRCWIHCPGKRYFMSFYLVKVQMRNSISYFAFSVCLVPHLDRLMCVIRALKLSDARKLVTFIKI